MTEPTTLRQLIDARLLSATGISLDQYVATRRRQGGSWQRIAGIVSSTTDVYVSDETLRTWYASTDQEVTP